MNIKTSRFGTIDVSEEEIVYFDEGLLGFAEYHRYVILNASEKNTPFRWLQCLDDGNLAFVIIEPLNFMFEYDLDVSDSDQEFVGLTRSEDAIIYAIVSIPSNPQNMTANLQGPLLINAVNRKGRQIISSNPKHLIKTKILDEMQIRARKIQELNKSLNPKEKGA
jgi:flagellar assembly factor FliW